MTKLTLVLVGFALVAALIAAEMTASRGTWVVGRDWPLEDRVSIDDVDHDAWNTLLARYVDDRGLVDYATWHGSGEDRQALDDYLATLSRADPSREASDAARLAFWINAYNALTIKGILREYPTTSIRNHTAGLWGYNIWKDVYLLVGDETYSLSRIEHGVLRKLGEPRIHFAIVCASLGCPRLLNRAYTAEAADHQLTENAKAFFASEQNFRYDTAAKTFAVPLIFDWFATDFGDTAGEQMATIAPYLPTTEAQRLAKSGQASISFLPWDWRLNDHSMVGELGKLR